MAAARITVGIDEVGRGAWAGPVVAGAAILPDVFDLAGLRDSKLVPPAEREQLARLIKQQAIAIGLGWVSSAEVDQYGLSWAVRQSGLRALAELGVYFDHVILDGRHNYLAADVPSSEVIIRADSLIPAVSAAAIIAKVARDRYMYHMDELFPQYGFASHVGYGTARHQSALALHGPCRLHRYSYKPIKELSHVHY